MNSIERMRAVYAGERPDRLPFSPVIREHSAFLIGRTPSEVARDAGLMAEAQLASYECYGHDMVSVGIDTYNLECEALGSEVVFFDGPEVPALAGPLLEKRSDLDRLRIPDPQTDARLPVILEAGTILLEEIGREVPVNCTVVGPFTMAANLRGFQNLVFDIMEDPQFVHRLLDFATSVSSRYAEVLHARGLNVSISESWISPPLLSPSMYRTFALPYERKLIGQISSMGQPCVALISGGDTTPILDGLLETGAALLVGDYKCDLRNFRERTLGAGVVLRANLDPKLVESGPVARLLEEARMLIDVRGTPRYFILGTGVVPYHTPPDNILALRHLAEKYRRVNGPR